MEEPPKAVTSSCTGSLELMVKQIEKLSQPNSNLTLTILHQKHLDFERRLSLCCSKELYVAVELKSCGSYLQVAETYCTELTTAPIWNEASANACHVMYANDD